MHDGIFNWILRLGKRIGTKKAENNRHVNCHYWCEALLVFEDVRPTKELGITLGIGTIFIHMRWKVEDDGDIEFCFAFGHLALSWTNDDLKEFAG